MRIVIAPGPGSTAHRLPKLAGQTAYASLAPVVGSEAAVRAIDAEERAPMWATGLTPPPFEHKLSSIV